MTGFRVRYVGGQMQLVCTECEHVCEVTDDADVADVAAAFIRLHPAHVVPAQHEPACPEGSAAPR